MIPLKKYYQPQVSLEQISLELESLSNLHVSVEAHPEFFGLEAIDLIGKYQLIKEVLEKIFKSVAKFLKEIWEKFFGKHYETKVETLALQLKEVEKEDVEVDPKTSDALKELVQENESLNAEPVVPEGLPKNIFTRLVKAHNAYYNQGPTVFKNLVVNDPEWFNDLWPLTLSVIDEHKRVFDSLINDDGKTVEDYEQAVKDSGHYKRLVEAFRRANITLNDFNYAETFYELNRQANEYVNPTYLILDVNYNSVYKAKLKDLSHGLETMKKALKDSEVLRNAGKRREDAFEKSVVALTSDLQLQKAKICGRHLTELTKACGVVSRLRKNALDVNIEYIDAVIAVMKHPSFKKRK